MSFGPKYIGYNKSSKTLTHKFGMLLGHITNKEKLMNAQLQLVDAFRCNNKSFVETNKCHCVLTMYFSHWNKLYNITCCYTTCRAL